MQKMFRTREEIGANIIGLDLDPAQSSSYVTIFQIHNQHVR
ncbi:MAG: hypothetical protein K0R61_688 [Microvirga sp.]|jgi:hypothetical protein|nr:hypothetical protein [Microvirga sp.]MDF2970238.1 hypothetical protein [Microvirga sp.]